MILKDRVRDSFGVWEKWWGRSRSRLRPLFDLRPRILLLMGVFALVGPSLANLINIEVCGGNCICINFDGGAYTEVRCTEAGGGDSGPSGGGWTSTPPPSGPMPDNDGSFTGGGQLQPPGTQPPTSTPIQDPTNVGKLSITKRDVNKKLALKCHKVGQSQEVRCFETTCTALFSNNKLHTPGRNLAGQAIYVGGQTYHYPRNGSEYYPCSEPSTYAFVDRRRGPNDRYIFLCDMFFSFPPETRAEFLIHELLHVAGQDEDLSSSSGPGNPPTSGEIDQLVANACTNPRDVGEGY